MTVEEKPRLEIDITLTAKKATDEALEYIIEAGEKIRAYLKEGLDLELVDLQDYRQGFCNALATMAPDEYSGEMVRQKYWGCPDAQLLSAIYVMGEEARYELKRRGINFR